MRGDLGYAEASALERLLIQQVTLCWLNLNLAEYRFTNVTKQSDLVGGRHLLGKETNRSPETFHSRL